MPTLQKLMNDVYDFWNMEQNQYLPKKKMREVMPKVLSKKHLTALKIGNLNYQVENGGFKQWYDKGYADLDLCGLLKFLEQIKGRRESIDKVHQILSKFSKYLEDYEEILSETRKLSVFWGYTEMFEDRLLEHFYRWIQELSEEYYKVNEKFLKDLEEVYFNK